jgi:hypothetical protein
MSNLFKLKDVTVDELPDITNLDHLKDFLIKLVRESNIANVLLAHAETSQLTGRTGKSPNCWRRFPSGRRVPS